MNAAIWALIGDSLPYLAGLLLAIYVIVAIYIALLDGVRVDRWNVFAKKGVMRSLQAEGKNE